MIYDCMIFNDEIEMLKLHLSVLYDVVDKFVIAEGKYTFSGRYKLFYNILEYKEELKPFQDKIIFIANETKPSENRWQNEAYLRECIAKGLVGAQPEDVIIIGDVDEISDPDIVRGAQNKEIQPFALDTFVYYYYLNLAFLEREITTSKCIVFTPFKLLGSIQKARDTRLSLPCIRFGWHFSYMGGTNTIAEKLRNFSHAEYDTPFYRDYFRIADKLKNKEDLFDRKNIKLGVVPIAPVTHPDYLIENIHNYKDWLYSDE